MGSRPGQRPRERDKDALTETSNTEGKALILPMISENEDKQAIFDFLTADMKDQGIWSPTFSPVVSSLADTIYQYNRDVLLLDEEGSVLPKYNNRGENVGVVQNPRFKNVAQLKGILLKELEHLGATPKAIAYIIRGGDAENAANQLPNQGDGPSSDGNPVVYFAD